MSDIQLNIGEKDGFEFYIDAEDILTERTAVIGMSGSGKSHLIGVLCEELSENNLPFIIIDPEGEYFSLKEKYAVIWASNDKRADIPLKMEIIDRLVEEVVRKRGRLIIDTSESSDEFEIVSYAMKKLYEIETELRMPITLIVEEADRFAPQIGGESIKALHEISRRGRKRGIGLVVVTQRPAMVDKNVLSQCGNQFIGRLRTENDIKAVKMFFSSTKERDSLPELKRGFFYVMGGISPITQLIKVRERKTRDLGYTPSISGKESFSGGDIIKEIKDNQKIKSGDDISAILETEKSQDYGEDSAEVKSQKSFEKKNPEKTQVANLKIEDKYEGEQSSTKNIKDITEMREIFLEHFIYGPVPKKGYAIRAESSAARASEYKDIYHGYYVPIDPIFIRDYTHEDRMIISSPQMEIVLFSRIFKRTKLDDKGRGGLLNHTVIIPRRALEEGLSYKKVERGLMEYEKINGISIGSMEPLRIPYEAHGKDEDLEEVNKLISKSSMEKIIKSFQKSQKSKIFIIAKNSTFDVRINISYILSKIVDIKLKLVPLRILTDPPLPLILDVFPNIVLSGKMIHLKPNKGWIVVKPFSGDMGSYSPVDERKVSDVIDDIYS